MALYGNNPTATATVGANTNVVTITGVDISLVTPGMTINLGARDRKAGDAWIIASVAPSGTNGGTVTTQGSITTAYNSVPFIIDTTGYLGTDASYAAAVGLSILSTLSTLLGVATNLYSGARQIVLDKTASTAIGRVAFAIAGRTWGDLSQRAYSYVPTGSPQVNIEAMAVRAFPDGVTPTDVLLVDLSAGTGDLRQATVAMASGTTVDLSSAPAGTVLITGGATITSFGPGKNLVRRLRLVGGATLKHNATSLFLPGAADITSVFGDTALAVSDGAGNWTVLSYDRASGVSLITPQVMSGNSGPAAVPPGSVRFFRDAAVGANAGAVYVPAGRRGRFRNLRVVTSSAPGDGQAYTVTLQKLFSNTALQCTILGSASNQAADLINSVVFAANERWCLKIETSPSAASAAYIAYSVDFEILE